LNRYPRLKQAFHQLPEEGFHNFELQWVGGMAPTLYILSESGSVINEETLSDMDKSELVNLITQHGVHLAVAIYDMPSLTQDPKIQTNIGGIHYELFLDQLAFTQAQEYAKGRTYEGMEGRLPTISCKLQEDELRSWIEGAGLDEELATKGIWLGATDEAIEGQWKWISNDMAFSDGLYTNWNEGEPNNANSNENCASWRVSQGWNDVYCNGKHAQLILVEYGPSESSLCSVVPPASPAPEGAEDL